MAKLFTASILLALVSAQAEIANTCVDQVAHLYGMHSEQALPFSDYNYIHNTEEFNTVYRMTRLQMCENAEGQLVGIRSHITRYDAENMTPLAKLSMNIVGTVTGTDIACQGLVLDALNGEYLTSMYFGYGTEGVIDYIRATTNKSQQLSMGQLTNEMTTSEMTSIHDSRILAFHGYETDRIASIGQVSVQLSCIKGVTTVQSVDEPILIDIEEIENSHVTPQPTQQDEHALTFIIIGVVVGVALMSAAGVIFWMYKKKRGCWARAAKGLKLNKTMPIGMSGSFKNPRDLELQKRSSHKQMSKIVEVDESGEGMHSHRF